MLVGLVAVADGKFKGFKGQKVNWASSKFKFYGNKRSLTGKFSFADFLKIVRISVVKKIKHREYLIKMRT